ncbi:hypothetical protein BC834DRAFT_458142 [Gloeopeniophorella convolvens]|nr:hypothetical protein BC834DRAFT_458142 [Gloeopeniophorella convolvens]
MPWRVCRAGLPWPLGNGSRLQCLAPRRARITLALSRLTNRRAPSLPSPCTRASLDHLLAPIRFQKQPPRQNQPPALVSAAASGGKNTRNMHASTHATARRVPGCCGCQGHKNGDVHLAQAPSRRRRLHTSIPRVPGCQAPLWPRGGARALKYRHSCVRRNACPGLRAVLCWV